MAERTELERRHRKCARIALYGSLLLTGCLTWGLIESSRAAMVKARLLPEGSQDWADVDWAAVPEVQLLRDYLRIDTSYPDGSEIAGARFLAGHLSAAGLEVTLVPLGETKANLWAILEGEDPGAIVLHNHIDVEPPGDLSLWKGSPFSGRIDGPWMYGRGAFDMKSVAIAQLAVVLELARSGQKPKKSVIFLATGSEEVGSDLGARWLVRNHPELVRRFEFFLTEGGVVEALSRQEVKYWGTSFGQKRFVDLLVCGPNRQRLYDLQEDVRRMEDWNPQPRSLPAEMLAMLDVYAPTRTREDLVALLAEPERILLEQDSFQDLLPDYLQVMTRDQAFPGRTRQKPGGSAVEMVIKLHLLPGTDPHEARRRLVPDWALWGLDWRLLESPDQVAASPVDDPRFQILVDSVKQQFPDVVSGPYFLPWTSTDARFFRALGIPSYGYGPFLFTAADSMTGSDPNERISLPGFVEGIGTYRTAVGRLAAGEGWEVSR